MKITIFALCFICTTAAFGQISTVTNVAQPLVMVDHPMHAIQHPMGTEQSVLESYDFTSAHGERPLWEFATVQHNVPLGDTARLLKQEHATVRKAEKVWSN